mmetsp:Transcript_44170/g.88739  ORF Transcript_44170/g.88739 Transcript_44170/m.88739 type:complete len:88 (+) Transcript_44170:166-429(+)
MDRFGTNNAEKTAARQVEEQQICRLLEYSKTVWGPTLRPGMAGDAAMHESGWPVVSVPLYPKAEDGRTEASAEEATLSWAFGPLQCQ